MVLQLWWWRVVGEEEEEEEEEEEVDGQPKVIKPPLLFSVARAPAPFCCVFAIACICICPFCTRSPILLIGLSMPYPSC